jgi:ATP-dependent DNA helicase RecQ
VFGIGEDMAEGDWRGVVRQMLAQGLLAVEGAYGTLVLTEASGTVLRREREVPLRKEQPKPATSRGSSSSSSGSGRAERKAKAAAAAAEMPSELLPAFEALRAWRAGQAKEQGVPAYVIFHDATLREIATLWPTSVPELGGISGIGEKKLATYGEGVVEVLAALERPAGAAGTPESGTPTPPPAPRPQRRSDGDPDLHWPEMDAEPEPEDWI